MQISWLMWAVFFAAIVLLSYAVFTYCANRRVVRERFKRVTTARAAATPILKHEKGSNLKKRFLEWVSGFGKWAMDEKDDLSKLRMSLIQAGYRHPKGPAIYFGMRALTAFCLPLPYLMANAMQWKLASGNLLFYSCLARWDFICPGGSSILRFAGAGSTSIKPCPMSWISSSFVWKRVWPCRPPSTGWG